MEPLKDSKANNSLVKEITEKLFGRQPSSLEALQQICVEIATEQLNCESAAIFVVDRNIARRVCVTGIPKDGFVDETYKVGQGLTGKVLRWSEEKQRLIGEIHACNTVSTNPEAIPEYVQAYKELLSSKKLEHLLAAPIENEDGIYAIIRVMNKKDRTGSRLDATGFSIKDKEVLSIIAMLVSCAWQHKISLKLMEELIEVGEKLAKTSPRFNIYQEISVQGKQLLDVEDCAVFAVDGTDDYLKLVASTTIKTEEFEEWQTSLSNLNNSLAKIVRAGKAYLPKKEEFRLDISSLNFDDLPSGYCYGLMLVPFFDHLNRCLGLMMVRNKNGPDKHSAFRGEDKKAARLLASLVGSSLQGEILYEREKEQKKRRIDILTSFTNLQTRVLAGIQNPPESLKAIANTAKELMRADLVCILPYYDNFQGITGFNPKWVTVSQGSHGSLEINAPRPRGLTWKAINDPRGHIIERISPEDSQIPAYLRQLNIHQVLGLPLKAQGYTFGVIFFDYIEFTDISSEDIFLARLIAGLTAQALMNAEYISIKDLKEIRAINTLKLQESGLKDITDGVSELSHTLLNGSLYARNRLDLALRDPALSAEVREHLVKARANVEYLLKITNCIMEFNILKVQGQNLEPVQLCEIIGEVIEQHQERALAKSIKLFCSSKGDLPIIQFNGAFAYYLLANLIANALDHTPTQGEIELRYYAHQEKIYISIKDNGTGMDNETKQKLFRIPFRGNRHTEKAIKGIGLGLYLANQLLETHGGRIWVEESQLGKGTTITFELPVGTVIHTAVAEAS